MKKRAWRDLATHDRPLVAAKRPKIESDERPKIIATRTTAATLLLVFLIGFCSAVNAADESTETPSPPKADGSPDEIQERGVGKGAVGDIKRKYPMAQPLPPSEPPAQLCHPETYLLTQCKCFSQTECQALTALFPNPCPPGSSHCEFTPMSRGTMPPLPPNLCSYQVPLTFTKCECHNQQECQLLTPFCQSSCPPGSTSCECTPMQRR